MGAINQDVLSMAKEVYGTVQNATVEKVNLLNKSSKAFTSFKTRLGRSFNEPVWLADESGITYAGSATHMTDLNGSVAGVCVEASASGCEIALQSQVTVKQLQMTSAEGKTAFKSFYTQMLSNMKMSITKRAETSLINGGESIGTVDGTPAGGPGTTRAITLTGESWIPGAFLGSKGAKLDAYNGSTKLNTLADIVIDTVDASDPTAPVINVTGNATDLAAIDDTHELYWKGSYGNECDGLAKICGLAAGESYLGIAVNDHPDLWAGNRYNVGGNFSFPALNAGLAEAAQKGGGGDYVLLCPPNARRHLGDDLDALRAFDSSYKPAKGELGNRGLMFHTDFGTCTVETSLFVKSGRALLFPKDVFSRKGSSDIDFKDPVRGETYFIPLETKHVVEVRANSDQMLWGVDPKSCVEFYGISG